MGEYCGYLNPCHTSSGPRCQNGGVCEVDYSSAVPTFRCRCALGFTASLCEISESNACQSYPCQNGGSCHLETLNDYVCSCAQGYTGKRVRRMAHIKLMFPQNALRVCPKCLFAELFVFTDLSPGSRQILRKAKSVRLITVRQWRHLHLVGGRRL